MKVLVVHHYLSTVEGIMTSMIDTYFNLKDHGINVEFKIYCPELYLMERDDYYNFPLDQTGWLQYKDLFGSVEIKEKRTRLSKDGFKNMKIANQVCSSIPFLRYNRNFGDYDLYKCIEQEKTEYEADIIICSSYILSRDDIKLKCKKLLVLDCSETYHCRNAWIRNYDLTFDKIGCEVVQFSNPAVMRRTRYPQQEYYHKFSKRRLIALNQCGYIKGDIHYRRSDKEKIKLFEGGYFENIGKKIFEHLYFDKRVYYNTDGMFTKDGLWYYLWRFGINGFIEQTLNMCKGEIEDKLFMKEDDELLNEIRSI